MTQQLSMVKTVLIWKQQGIFGKAWCHHLSVRVTCHPCKYQIQIVCTVSMGVRTRNDGKHLQLTSLFNSNLLQYNRQVMISNFIFYHSSRIVLSFNLATPCHCEYREININVPNVNTFFSCIQISIMTTYHREDIDMRKYHFPDIIWEYHLVENILIKLVNNISSLQKQLAEKYLMLTNTACWKSTQVCRISLLKNISIKSVNNISSCRIQLAAKVLKFVETACWKTCQVCRIQPIHKQTQKLLSIIISKK